MGEVIVKKSGIQGQGTFAVRNFKKGEVVLCWRPKIITNAEAKELPAQETPYLIKTGVRFLLMQPPERYVNHSCDANTEPRGRKDVAIRDIKKGEEITSDYSKLKADHGFKCNCGSQDCKGIIE